MYNYHLLFDKQKTNVNSEIITNSNPVSLTKSSGLLKKPPWTSTKNNLIKYITPQKISKTATKYKIWDNINNNL